MTVFDFEKYRNGGEGFAAFAEENLCIPIYPMGTDIPVWIPIKDLPDTPHTETGKSYKGFWEQLKAVMIQALEMRDGRFVHRLIILCWPRGEAKSFIVCAVKIWKLMVFPQQKIVLSANSKDQSVFVHFNIIKDMILNSPKILSLIGAENVREKNIRLLDSKGRTVSTIQPVTSFTGVLSNITGYTFSEIFQMTNPKFFEQIDGSIRNIPNAFGMIDSTVSGKDHILYQLYEAWIKKLDPTLFFSYRFSKLGDTNDYWHPNQTIGQLNSYRVKNPFGGFERYFLNLWSAGAAHVFPREQVQSIYYLGADGNLASHDKVVEMNIELMRIYEGENIPSLQQGLVDKGIELVSTDRRVNEIESRLWPCDKEYKLSTPYGKERIATIDELLHLGDMYDTDWAILAGIDRSEPFKEKRTGARTIVCGIAKGLPGSRTNQYLGTLESPKYIYFLVGLRHIETSALEDIKSFLKEMDDEYGGIDVVCSERWGVWDLKDWCEAADIKLDMLTGTYPVQLAAFTEMYKAVENGRFKSARLCVLGARSKDILEEELLEFDHDPDAKWFGSPEKKKRYGIQDDSSYSVAYCIYGGRFISSNDFRPRGKGVFLGSYHENKTDLLGRY